jgi:hypothetical protein
VDAHINPDVYGQTGACALTISASIEGEPGHDGLDPSRQPADEVCGSKDCSLCEAKNICKILNNVSKITLFELLNANWENETEFDFEIDKHFNLQDKRLLFFQEFAKNLELEISRLARYVRGGVSPEDIIATARHKAEWSVGNPGVEKELEATWAALSTAGYKLSPTESPGGRGK